MTGEFADDRNLNFGIRYASPFHTIAQLYHSTDIKGLFRWCQYYINADPIISTIIQKMSEYPITEVIFDCDDAAKRSQYKAIFLQGLKIRSFLVQVGLRYFGYGNGFVSIGQSFLRYLKCPNCAKLYRLRGLTPNRRGEIKYKWDKNWFAISCPACAYSGTAEVEDKEIARADSIRLIQWDPKQIEIEWNPVTHDRMYKYILSKDMRKGIGFGRPFIVETLPYLFLDAYRQKAPIDIDPNNIFHFARPHNTGDAGGWGRPLIMPVMQDLFHMQILRKAEEAIMQQHILPLWVIFPAPQGDTNPVAQLNLGNWKVRVEEEIKKWKRDPNYVPIMPIPMGFQYLGGQGKQLDVSPIMESTYRRIIAGMDVPEEFVFGGTNSPYASSNINLRLLMNSFINYREGIDELLNGFIIPKVCSILKIEPVKARLSELKFADDVQLKQLLINLAQGKTISLATLLNEFNLDYDAENDKRRYENEQEQRLLFDQQKLGLQLQNQLQDLAAANAMGDALQQAQMQVPSMDPSGGSNIGKGWKNGSGGTSGNGYQFDPTQMASQYAKTIMGMPPERAQGTLVQLQNEMPQLHKMVVEMLDSHRAGQEVGEDRKEKEIKDRMRKTPDKLPPRRG